MNIESNTAYRMPLKRNPHFVGRESAISELRDRLSSSDPAKHVQVLTGPGGIGKTQLAAEYVHRFAETYRVVWWIFAEPFTSLEVGLAQLAKALNLSEQENTSNRDLRRLLNQYLSTHGDWLLVFDEVSSAKSLRQLLPAEVKGHVLVTSRGPEFASELWADAGQVFPVEPFAREESLKLLAHLAKRDESPEMFDRLVTALDDLPMAISHAAGFINETEISFAQYLERFEQCWGELLATERVKAGTTPSLILAWELTFRFLETQSPFANDILQILSCYSADAIPRRLLESAATFAPDDLATALKDPMTTAELLARLQRQGCIIVDPSTIRVHSLVAQFARDRLSYPERQTWAEVAVRSIRSNFKFDENNALTWNGFGSMLGHALFAARHADNLNISLEFVRSIFNEAGQYLMEMGQFDNARTLLERAMAIAQNLWGNDNPRISAIANNLGRLYLRLGKAELAYPFFQQALRLDSLSYGPNHPHVAETMNNRGICLHTIGEHASAELDFNTALKIYREQYGESHAKIASILNNLGYAFAGRKNFVKARARLMAALDMAHLTLGERHPTLSTVLRNLGLVCRWLGQPRQAYTSYRKALEIDSAIFGNDSADVATDVAGMGEAMEDLGNLGEAKKLLMRAVGIVESLEHDRGRMKKWCELLSRIHETERDYAGAEHWKEKAKSGREFAQEEEWAMQMD